MSEDPPESVFKVVSWVCYHLVVGNASDLPFASFWLCPQRNIMTVSFGIDTVFHGLQVESSGRGVREVWGGGWESR